AMFLEKFLWNRSSRFRSLINEDFSLWSFASLWLEERGLAKPGLWGLLACVSRPSHDLEHSIGLLNHRGAKLHREENVSKPVHQPAFGLCHLSSKAARHLRSTATNTASARALKTPTTERPSDMGNQSAQTNR